MFRRTSETQSRRTVSGKKWEQLAYDLVSRDPKLKGWKVSAVEKVGEPGMDLLLEPPGGCTDRPEPGCEPPVKFEVKSVEKLFENCSDPPWMNRLSRWTLKMSELNERPPCYVLVSGDELSGNVVVDCVDSKRILDWLARIKGTPLAPKLPVRALVGPRGLRNMPCKYTSGKRGKPFHIER